MEYKVLSRPKLARNKYGKVDDKEAAGGGSSYFTSSTSQSAGGGTEYSEFVGSTNTLDGKKGLVPAPKTNNDEPLIDNDNIKFLKGTGAWVDIPVSRYTTENANKDGIDLDGNLTVSDTITTQTLNVLGAAHFWELVIDKVKAAGGNLLITPANFTLDYIGSDITYTVDETQSPFTEMFFSETNQTGILGLKELFTNNSLTALKAKRLYQKNSDGSTKIASEFEIGDMVRCKTLNLDENSGFTNKDYWTFVLGTGVETYNNESCMYIDVLYQYIANGTTYGLGTSIVWQDTPVDTHLTLHEDDMEIGADYMCEVGDMFIATSDKSSGNCGIELGDTDMKGDLSWDGSKWIIDGTNAGVPNTDILPNTSFTFTAWGNTGYLECVYDSRWTDPVIKIRVNNINDNTLDGIMYAWGVFYIEDYVEDSGSSTTPLLESFKFGYGTFTPEVGDNLVALGHLWEADRQGAILISSYDPMDIELKAPAIAQYEGINQFTSLSPFRTTSIAANGNNFEGKFLVNYNGNYIDINERLNIFNADLNTGLETVGIHLDGENSTIKLVGSVEIKQNGDEEPDTLTVWDNNDKMRVKISPEAIPNLSNIDTQINPSSVKSFRTLSGQNYPTGGDTYHQHSYKYFLWKQWDHQWKYWLQDGYYRYTSTMDIGTFTAGQRFSVSNLSTNIRSRAYFKGIDYVSTRSESGHTQSISDVILRLKRYNGTTWTTVNTYNLSNTATKTCADESATISLPNTIIDNYTISTAGSYRLELEIVHNVYATITYSSQQSSAYFMFDYSVRSTVDLIQPSASMTRIGRNGLVFNTDSAGQYFYAGNDGIEMKWGDVGIRLNSNIGYSRFKKIYTVNNSGTRSSYYQYNIPIDADIIFVNGDYVRLITTASSNIPEGKEIIIIGKVDSNGKSTDGFGNPYTDYATANIYNPPCSVLDSAASEDGRTWTGTVERSRKHFIWHNLEWWEI